MSFGTLDKEILEDISALQMKFNLLCLFFNVGYYIKGSKHELNQQAVSSGCIQVCVNVRC